MDGRSIARISLGSESRSVLLHALYFLDENLQGDPHLLFLTDVAAAVRFEREEFALDRGLDLSANESRLGVRQVAVSRVANRGGRLRMEDEAISSPPSETFENALDDVASAAARARRRSLLRSRACGLPFLLRLRLRGDLHRALFLRRVEGEFCGSVAGERDAGKDSGTGLEARIRVSDGSFFRDAVRNGTNHDGPRRISGALGSGCFPRQRRYSETERRRYL